MLKSIIVEDEFPARQELANILNNISEVELIKSFDDSNAALQYLRVNNDIDIAFLDIDMPGLNGLQLAKKVQQFNQSIAIIFSTGFSEFAVDAFELSAFDYLLKPYTEERVLLSIYRLLKTRYSRKNGVKIADKIPFWVQERLVLFAPEKEIYFVQSDQKKRVLISTAKGTFETTLTLKELEDKLKPYNFLRTHKGYIVNMNKISEIIPWFNNTYILKLSVSNEFEIPVSRHFLPEFKRNLGLK